MRITWFFFQTRERLEEERRSHFSAIMSKLYASSNIPNSLSGTNRIILKVLSECTRRKYQWWDWLPHCIFYVLHPFRLQGTFVFIYDHVPGHKILLWIFPTSAWIPINHSSLSPQNHRVRTPFCGLCRDRPHWSICPNSTEKTAAQPRGQTFSAPK